MSTVLKYHCDGIAVQNLTVLKIRAVLLGYVGALWLETVLVSDVLHSVGDTIGAHEAELSTDGDAFVLTAFVLHLALLIRGNAVTGFVTEKDIFSDKIGDLRPVFVTIVATRWAKYWIISYCLFFITTMH